jgi:hypothetical protein
MLREFIETSAFKKQWAELNLDDDDLYQLQVFLMQNLSAGDTIQGTGGAVKICWALHGKSKREGARIIYIDFVHIEHTYLLLCYPKSKKVITPASKYRKPKARYFCAGQGSGSAACSM